jgi:hypothetical protein
MVDRAHQMEETLPLELSASTEILGVSIAYPCSRGNALGNGVAINANTFAKMLGVPLSKWNFEKENE